MAISLRVTAPLGPWLDLVSYVRTTPPPMYGAGWLPPGHGQVGLAFGPGLVVMAYPGSRN